MMNLQNKKTKKIVTGIIIAFLVISMVLPMVLSGDVRGRGLRRNFYENVARVLHFWQMLAKIKKSGKIKLCNFG